MSGGLARVRAAALRGVPLRVVALGAVALGAVACRQPVDTRLPGPPAPEACPGDLWEDEIGAGSELRIADLELRRGDRLLVSMETDDPDGILLKLAFPVGGLGGSVQQNTLYEYPSHQVGGDEAAIPADIDYTVPRDGLYGLSALGGEQRAWLALCVLVETNQTE